MKDSNEPQFPRKPAPHIERQFILTGRIEDIEAILKLAQVRFDHLRMQQEIVIADLASRKRKLPGLEDKRSHVIRYYLYEDDVAPLIHRINRLSSEKRIDVSADFNHLISATPWTVAGSPWTVAGSPWTVAGSPWTVAGSPWTVAGSPWQSMGDHGGEYIREKAIDIFYSQWAFGEQGLRARPEGEPPSNVGSGVRVGVFDTSPFPVTFRHADFDLSPDLHLTLAHPIPGGVSGGCGPGPAADHGLFVAGLIHALAPYSDIHLIRVLDDAAQGLMSTLLIALARFIREVGNDGSLRGAVINLSLGLADSDEGGRAEPASLRLLLDVANALGIVVVAAAGNDSAPTPGSHGPQIPAAWETVIGVSASNYERKLACYSNAGDVMAPGGGGVAPYCQPGLDRCRTADCKYALISLSTASWTGFGYGVGSSFAAPLVSGLAAIIQSVDGWLPCVEIKQKILSSAIDGVVDGQSIL